jgi:hypothetical protein
MDDVVAVVTDVFFQSRVSAAARAAGRQLRFVTSTPAADADLTCTLGLVDLDARLDVEQSIRALKAGGAGQIVAFGPHLDTESRKRARSAGADRVLAKSKFVTELPRMMNDGSHPEQHSADAEHALDVLREYGRRMEDLGRMLQDPETASRLAFVSEPQSDAAQAVEDAIVLDVADFEDIVKVEALISILHRARQSVEPSGREAAE